MSRAEETCFAATSALLALWGASYSTEKRVGHTLEILQQQGWAAV